MSKTFKDRPEKYKIEKPKYKPKTKRFVPTKGRSKDKLKYDIEDYLGA